MRERSKYSSLFHFSPRPRAKISMSWGLLHLSRMLEIFNLFLLFKLKFLSSVTRYDCFLKDELLDYTVSRVLFLFNRCSCRNSIFFTTQGESFIKEWDEKIVIFLTVCVKNNFVNISSVIFQLKFQLFKLH